jgi:Protein of unknown function (DUF2934)
MPTDISMCSGGDCPQKAHCLRFTGAIYGRQDFFGTPPYLQAVGQCAYFMDDRPSQEAIRAYAYSLWEQSGRMDGNADDNWQQAEIELLNRRRLL